MYKSRAMATSTYIMKDGATQNLRNAAKTEGSLNAKSTWKSSLEKYLAELWGWTTAVTLEQYSYQSVILT
jgi:hypothetical protein